MFAWLFNPCRALFLFLLLVLVASAETPTYKVGMVAWIGWSSLNVAQQQGFWKDEGLNVEVIIFDRPSKMHEAFESDQIQLCMEFVGTVVSWYMQGKDVKLIAETGWSHGGDKIILKKGEHFSRMRGEVIGTFIDSPAVIYFLSLYLKSLHMKPTDFRIRQMEPDDLLLNFIDGNLKAMINYDPHTIRAVKEGNGYVVANSSKFPGCLPDGVVMKTSTLNAMPKEDLINFFRGWVMAVRWLQDPGHKKPYGKLVNEITFHREQRVYNHAAINALLGSTKMHKAKTLMVRNRKGGGVEKYLMDLQRFLEENGRLKKRYGVGDVFDGRAVLAAAESFLAK